MAKKADFVVKIKGLLTHQEMSEMEAIINEKYQNVLIIFDPDNSVEVTALDESKVIQE